MSIRRPVGTPTQHDDSITTERAGAGQVPRNRDIGEEDREQRPDPGPGTAKPHRHRERDSEDDEAEQDGAGRGEHHPSYSRELRGAPGSSRSSDCR